MIKNAVFSIVILGLTLAGCSKQPESQVKHLVGVTVYGKDNLQVTGEFVLELLKQGATPAKSAATADITVGVEDVKDSKDFRTLVARDRNSSVLCSTMSVYSIEDDADELAEAYSASRQKEGDSGRTSLRSQRNQGSGGGASRK